MLFYFFEVTAFREKHYVGGIVFNKHKSLVHKNVTTEGTNYKMQKHIIKSYF